MNRFLQSVAAKARKYIPVYVETQWARLDPKVKYAFIMYAVGFVAPTLLGAGTATAAIISGIVGSFTGVRVPNEGSALRAAESKGTINIPVASEPEKTSAVLVGGFDNGNPVKPTEQVPGFDPEHTEIDPTELDPTDTDFEPPPGVEEEGDGELDAIAAEANGLPQA